MKRKLAVLTLLLVSTYTFSSPRQDTPTSEAHFALGTVCTVTLYEKTNASVFRKAFLAVDEIDWKMSVQKDGSDLSLINAAAGSEMISVSNDTFTVITAGIRYGDLSGGLFDITIQPLVDLWGIGTDWQNLPTAEEIASVLNLVNYKSVVLDSEKNGVYLPEPGMAIDLGGIAKGYAADVVKKVLLESGYSRGILNFGGNVLTFGAKQNGDPWKVGVQNPLSERGDYLGIIETAENSVVTSGVYERFFELDGKRYHHILDTYTGMPVDNGLLSVTIVTPDGMTADAISTIAFAMGLERGMNLIENTQNMEAVFITSTKEIYVSSGIGDQFILNDDSFVLR